MNTKIKLLLSIFALFATACASDTKDDSVLLLQILGTADSNKSIVVLEVASNFTDYTGECYDTFTIGGSSNATISPTNYYNNIMFGHSLDTDLKKSGLSTNTCTALGFLGSGIPTNSSPVAFKVYYCDPNLGQANGACSEKIKDVVGF